MKKAERGLGSRASCVSVCCGLVEGCMRWQTRELAAAQVHTLSIRRGQEQFAKDRGIVLS